MCGLIALSRPSVHIWTPFLVSQFWLFNFIFKWILTSQFYIVLGDRTYVTHPGCAVYDFVNGTPGTMRSLTAVGEA